MPEVSKKAILQTWNRILCALFYIVAGNNHFLRPEIYSKIMPAYLPFPLELVYISGVFEVMGGLGLLGPITRKFAAWGLILLLLAVFPANINMYMHPELTPSVPPIWLLFRLPLQLLLIYWAWSCRK